MTVDELKDKIHRLQYSYYNDPTEMLQEICEDFLKHFYLETCGWIIWPTEVEAYCYCKRNPDHFVHRNILQKNRFGYLYVHRNPDNPNNDKGKNTPKGRAGMDVCLSDNDEMYFGMLIRSAYVTGHGNSFLATGPNKLYKGLCEGQSPDYFNELERQSALKEWGDRKGYVFFSGRIGLPEGKDDMFADRQLRAVIGESLVGTHFRMKEALFNGMKLPVEKKREIAGVVLGYVPSGIKEQ